MSAHLRPVAVSGVTATLCALLLLPLSAIGDDLEVYLPPLDADFRPTLMFMVDTSGSMEIEEAGFTSGRRRDRLINPLVDFVSSARNVRAGLSAFNGQERGGAIIAAAEDLDLDLCPDATCDSITLRVPILRSSDDAKEDVDSGGTSYRTALGELGEIVSIREDINRSVAAESDSVLETATSGVVEAEALTAFRNEAGETTAIGLRFGNFPIPADASNPRVFLQMGWFGHEYLDPTAGEGAGVAKARITLDSRADAPPFSNEVEAGVTDRPRLPGHVDWDIERPADWETAGDDTNPWLYSPDLTDLFQINNGPGTDNGATLVLEPVPGATVDKTNTVFLAGFNRNQNGHKPLVRYFFDDPDKRRPAFISGFRFDRLKVPPGAVVTSAHLELEGRVYRVGEAEMEIRAEQSGHAPAFTQDANALSSRTMIDDHVAWNFDSSWSFSGRYRTPDLSGLVQQVVSRGDWCSGNALSLHIQGTGERAFWFKEGGDDRAPVLHLTYQPSGVSEATACAAQPSQDALVLASVDDVVQFEDQPPLPGLELWRSGNSGRPMLGLRFKDVNLGPNDEIAEAELTLTSTGSPRHYAEYRVWVDSDTAADPLNANTDLFARNDGEPEVYWLTRQLSDGERVTSIDMAALIQKAIDDPGWVRGDDIVLLMRHIRGAQVLFATSHATGTDGPSLRIARRVRGAAAMDVPLRTARDRLIEKLQALPTTGETPLLDAFYETAQYMSGREVVHGRLRGEQGIGNVEHRLSDPDSWTGGTISRPLDCDPDKPGTRTCIEETIEGTPVYTAPPTSECRVNQIVLVTDGSPTVSPSDTDARVDTLTGGSDCVNSPDGQSCLGSLANWLIEGDAGRAPVRVNTIGFSFQSTLLEHVAEQGGGLAFSVNSAGALADALIDIGRSRDDTSFALTAPSVSVSQFNRSEHRDDVYLGLFAADRSVAGWSGNVKRYTLGALEGAGFGLIDADGRAAIDPETGRFVTDARSFWTASPDGAIVDIGGAAGRLPLQRRILTWPAASVGGQHGARELVPFHPDTAAIAAGDLGVDVAQRDDAIRWMQGYDTYDADGDSVTDEARRHLGAAFHTTPTIIDYPSSDAAGRSVVFAGTQEGMLHAIDTATGRELFAFLPFEVYANAGAFLKAVPGPMRYGLDGPVTSWTSDENRNGVVDDGEQAFITVGMRRGGGHYYTLDVSDPDNPSLAWTIDASRDGFEAMGQSWSAMQRARLRIPVDEEGVSVQAALVFANGYDPINDARDRAPAERGDGDQGAIYLIEPRTGALLHHVGVADNPAMVRSIPADVAVIDTELDGITDLLLVGDVGGNLWRVDLPELVAEDGAMLGSTPVLSLAAMLGNPTGDAADATAANDRRFFHSPDVALLDDVGGSTRLGVAIGSGRRDNPLGTAINDRLYVLNLDHAFTSTIAQSDLADASDGATPLTAQQRGWFADLNASGEKVLGTPVILNGQVLVNSYVPPVNGVDSCDPDLGTGRFNVLNVFDGAPETGPAGEEPVDSIELAAKGIPPSVTVVLNADRAGAPAIMAGTQFLDVVDPGPSRMMTYWIAD